VAVLSGAALFIAACVGDDADTGDSPSDGGSPQAQAPQFVVRCAVSHIGFDDPIVLPWQPGKSHQHQFFGNIAVDSDPAYGRVEGAPTSCEERLDNASYWAPTLLDERGRRVESLGLTATFRSGRGIDPADVVAYPAGFMVIGGNAVSDETQSTDIVAWSCGDGPALEAIPPECGADSSLRMIVTFPDCWDGRRLTGFGSSAHVRYSDGGCPDSHPVAVPQLTIGIDYPPVAPGGLSLSSGPIETAHADFWNVWDQDKLEDEVAMCITAGVVCGAPG